MEPIKVNLSTESKLRVRKALEDLGGEDVQQLGEAVAMSALSVAHVGATLPEALGYVIAKWRACRYDPATRERLERDPRLKELDSLIIPKAKKHRREL